MNENPTSPPAPPGDPIPRTLLAAPLLLGALVLHFVAVAMYVGPPNPASTAARPWVDAYIHPYFTQRWQLFAPEPAGRNQVMHIRCTLDSGAGPQLTPWIDITTPLVEAHQRNRLGSASRMLRATEPRLFPSQGRQRKALERLGGPLAEQAREALDHEADVVFSRGKAHLQRLASAECKRRHAAAGVQIARVEARRVVTKVPPYGRRHEPNDDQGTAYVMPTMDYVEVDL